MQRKKKQSINLLKLVESFQETIGGGERADAFNGRLQAVVHGVEDDQREQRRSNLSVVEKQRMNA
jgi:hypothetical protein